MANTHPPAWNLPPRSAMDDPMSSFFLHHSDNPGLILVSQQLTGENFASWSRSMKIALSVKNKLGFIDGSIHKPAAADVNLLNAWTRNNNIVISWLLNSVSKDISASILFAESALNIWNDLKDRFQQSNGPRIFQIRRELLSLRQDQDSVSIYFTKLKSLWNELNHFRPTCDCGKCVCNGVKNIDAYFHMDYNMTFLMGLNDSFAHVRSQVLLLEPLPPITRVFALVMQEERQRMVGASSTPNSLKNEMAFMLKGEPSQKPQSSRTRQKFHRGRPYCTACKAQGHTVDTCYKIHGYPPGFKHHNSTSNRASNSSVNQVSTNTSSRATNSSSNIFQNLDKTHMDQLLNMLIQHISASDINSESQEGNNISGTCFSISVPKLLKSPTYWIVDSGASKHICANIDAFVSYM
ncbi:uncharacterized protein [Henckelia pumila]|uniref:uncharacterized protein n=1 Tax=Henckelia pumila TaxID=405737 RepID=UPI003C6E5DC6